MKKIIFLLLLIVVVSLFTIPKVRMAVFGNPDAKNQSANVLLPKIEDYTEQYNNDRLRISFKHPKGWTVGEHEEDGGTLLVLQDSKNAAGLQIFITDFDESPDSITSERIKTDIPDMKIENVETIEIEGKTKATLFASDNPAFGNSSWELWFAHNGKLFQISTFENQGILLEQVIRDWKFL